MLQGILSEGCIYGIMVLAVFITFRVLNFADMTVDGSFPLGGCLAAVIITKGGAGSLSLLAAFAAGFLAGIVTALIHSKLKVPGLLAGILTMTMLYSVNLRIMSGSANLSLLRTKTLFTRAQNLFSSFSGGSLSPDWGIVIFVLAAAVIVMLLLNLFFHTDLGLTMGALGSNPQMITAQGMNPELIKGAGIALANGLASVAGALAVMYNGFADVNSGTGIVVSGLASLMLGEFLLKSNRIAILTLRALLGSILYRALMYWARSYGYMIGMTANDLRLVTGLLIILCLIISRLSITRPAGVQKRKKQC